MFEWFIFINVCVCKNAIYATQNVFGFIGNWCMRCRTLLITLSSLNIGFKCVLMKVSKWKKNFNTTRTRPQKVFPIFLLTIFWLIGFHCNKKLFVLLPLATASKTEIELFTVKFFELEIKSVFVYLFLNNCDRVSKMWSNQCIARFIKFFSFFVPLPLCNTLFHFHFFLPY